MPRSPALVVVAVLAAAGPRGVGAQTGVSVGFGVGTVRLAGGTSFGIASLGPTLRLVAPGRELSLGGTFGALPQGDWYTQGRADFWASTPALASRWRLAIDLGLSGATQGAGSGSGAGLLVAEALWVGPRWGMGLGAGPASGWISHGTPVTAFHARLRGWWQGPAARLALSASIAPTRFLGAWFTDVDAGLVARRDRLEARVSATGRLSETYGSKSAAIASVEWRWSPRVSLEASGGTVLPDPYQGFPRTGFITAGIRLHLSIHPTTASPIVTGGPLTVIRRAGRLAFRLRQPGARTVSIAGDWNAWTAAPLAHVGSDVWEVVLPLSPGFYHFALFIDGVAWTIPHGVPSVPDGMGGRVAVLSVL
jgi:hypothetical protein